MTSPGGLFPVPPGIGSNGVPNGGMRWRGQWSSGTAYLFGDVVSQGTNVYVCTTPYTPSMASFVLNGGTSALTAAASAQVALPGIVLGDLALVLLSNASNITGIGPAGSSTVQTIANGVSGKLTAAQYTIQAADVTNQYITIPAQTGTGDTACPAVVQVFRNAAVDVFGQTASSLTSPAITPVSSGFSLAYAMDASVSGVAVGSQASLSNVRSQGVSVQTTVAAGMESSAAGVPTTARLWTFANGAAASNGNAGTINIITNTAFPAGNFQKIGATV